MANNGLGRIQIICNEIAQRVCRRWDVRVLSKVLNNPPLTDGQLKA